MSTLPNEVRKVLPDVIFGLTKYRYGFVEVTFAVPPVDKTWPMGWPQGLSFLFSVDEALSHVGHHQC